MPVIQPTICSWNYTALHGATHCICLTNLPFVFEITLHLSTGSFNIELGAFFKQTHILWFLSIRPRGFLSLRFYRPSIPSAIEGEQDAGYFVGRSLSVNPEMWKIQIFLISLSLHWFSPKQYILITELKLWKTEKSFWLNEYIPAMQELAINLTWPGNASLHLATKA